MNLNLHRGASPAQQPLGGLRGGFLVDGRRCIAAAAAATRKGGSDNGGGNDPPPPSPTAPQQQRQNQHQRERFVVSARELLRDYRGAPRVRVDQYLADRWPAARALAAGASASRARVQQALRSGLVLVNGTACTKPSSSLRAGDVVLARLPPQEALARAEPEAGLDLNVVWEDAHCAVVWKPAGMVVHPSPGHARGTLVNALLHHLGLPAMEAGELLTGNKRRVISLGGSGVEEGVEGEDDDGYDDGDDDDEDDDADPFSEEEEEKEEEQQQAVAAAAATGGAATAAAAASPAAADQRRPPAFSSSSSSSPPAQAAAAAAPAPSRSAPAIVRPGIVHRLDRGTTGLMVVAKTDAAHARLCAQFKARTVGRVYASVMAPLQPLAGGGRAPLLRSFRGRVATNVARDLRDRLRMAAAPYGSARGRPAASNYRAVGSACDPAGAAAAAVAAARAGGWGGGDSDSEEKDKRRSRGGGGGAPESAAALPPLVVEWRLETGRTHQIRVHARHLGWPLAGDDAYGPGNASAARAIAASVASASTCASASEIGAGGWGRGGGGSGYGSSQSSSSSSKARAVQVEAAVLKALDAFGRPALHARHLAFDHPVTGERLSFDCGLPDDMLALLRDLGEALGGDG